jgi:hypothetical protein
LFILYELETSMIWIRMLSAALMLYVVPLFAATNGAVRPEDAVRGFLKVSASGLQTQARHLSGYAVQRKTPLIVEANVVVGFVFELSPRGFVVTTNNQDLPPVLAYSLTGDLGHGAGAATPLFAMVMHDIRLRLQALSRGDTVQTAANRSAWTRLEAGATAQDAGFQQWPPEGSTPTGGWLETAWGQEAPYNLNCPSDPISHAKTPTGCVATAMAQILHYHRSIGAAHFTASDKYASGSIAIDQDSARYNFPGFMALNRSLDSIRAKYATGRSLDPEDISALMFSAGVACRMNYGAQTSSAYVDSMRAGFIRTFGYSSAEYTLFPGARFYQLASSNIMNGLPLYFSIAGEAPANHGVVCDGYNSMDFFHLNFGWGETLPDSMLTAWYLLPKDLPGGYDLVRAMVHNIVPNAIALEARNAFHRLFPLPGWNTARVVLVNHAHADILVSEISVPPPFSVSYDSISFSQAVTNRIIRRDLDSLELFVQFSPVVNQHYSEVLTVAVGGAPTNAVRLEGMPSGIVISSSTVSGQWTDTGVPYYILKSCGVGGGALTIREGTHVIFLDGASLTIGEGQLLVSGTAARPVVLTSPGPRDPWGGLEFDNSGIGDTVRFCQITNSIAGAVHCQNSSPVFQNCMIVNNRSYNPWSNWGGPGRPNGGGGAVSLALNSKPVFSGCLISNNTAGSYGGGSGEAMRWGEGGAFWITSGSEPTILHCTITRNRAENIAGAVYINNAGMVLQNSIVWGDTSVTSAFYPSLAHPEIVFDQSPQTNAIINTIIFRNVFKGQILDADPLFTSPSANAGVCETGLAADWSLLPESPAIDAAVQVRKGLLLDVDILGNPRVHGVAADLGALECQADAPFIRYQPLTSLDFGTVPLGEERTNAVTITGSGTVPVSVQAFNLVQAEGKFQIVNPPQSATLAPGDSIQLLVKYTPDLPQSDEAVLSFASTSRNSPVTTISLKGSGVLGTLVQGDIGGVWIKSQSPYNVVGNCRILPGGSLRIESGVRVIVRGNYAITVGRNALLSIQGAVLDTVVFSGMEPWGGIRCEDSGSDDVLAYALFEGNSVSGAPEGIIAAVRSYPTIDHCTFRDNTGIIVSTIDGGALIENCLFARNTGLYTISGKVTWPDTLPDSTSRVRIVGNRFDGNRNLEGTAINIDNTTTDVIHNTFIANQSLYAPVTINALATWASGPGDRFNLIDGNTIANNNGDPDHTTNQLAISSRQNASICNNLIVNNVGVCGGGAMILDLAYGRFYVVNNTIAQNDNQRAVVLGYGSADIRMINNIIWKNSTNTHASAPLMGLPVFTIQRNCWDESGLDTTNLLVDPGFVHPSSSVGPIAGDVSLDWRLTSGSGCINRGRPDVPGFALPRTDIDGNRRIWDGMIDIGAYEFGSAAPGSPSAPVLRSPAANATGQPVSVRFIWNAVEDAVRYHLQVCQDPTFQSPYVFNGVIADTSRQIGGLQEGGEYHWKVAAADDFTEGAWSEAVAFVTGIAAPTELNAHMTTGGVELTWIDKCSAETGFIVERRVLPAGGFVAIDTVAPNVAHWVDSSATPGTTVAYRVRAFTSSASSAYSNEVSVAVTSRHEDQVPLTYALHQNYPNPFNPNSVIRYQISEFGIVRLAVYDVLGREVAVLVNERKEPGNYTVRFDGSGLASGVYIYRMAAGAFVEARRMVLVR